MKKFLIALVLMAVAIAFVGCKQIDPGYVGLKVYTVGTNRGDIVECGVGRYSLGLDIEWYEFPTFVKTYVWTQDSREGSPDDESFTFQTSEGMTISADVGISIQIQPEEGIATKIFTTYRRGIDELIDSVIRNMVRDSLNSMASDYTVDDVIGSGKTELLDKVENAVRERFAPDGINVISLSWVNSLRLPEQVLNALNAKIEATQLATQRENEVRTAEAEARKAVAEAEGRAQSVLLEAQAQAQANRLLAQSLTPELIRMRWIDAWDGKLPQVSSGNDGSVIVDMRP